jgi:hypothetical protein
MFMSKQQQERHFQERHPSMFIRLRLALVFALVILMVSFGYYYLHVQRKSDYLTSRNFRLLTSMGKRIESSVRGQTRALKNLSEKKDFMTAVRDEKKHEQRKNEILRVLAPQFEYVELRDEKAPLAKAWHKTVSGPDGPTFRFFHQVSKGKVLEGEVKLSRLVERPLASRGAFETVLLADQKGAVIYQQGTSNLGITHLSTLVQQKEEKGRRNGPEPAASGVLFGASEHREGVQIAGQRYRLFVEPFSLPIQAHGNTSGPSHQETWLLCGLIPEKQQVLKSMAVSSALLLLLLGGLLLALLSWPFLKLRLLGERQRVRRLDVGLVALCSLAGASIATLAVLDLFAFHRFTGQAEAQVVRLAHEMEERLLVEIFKAHEQLVKLEADAKNHKKNLLAKNNVEKEGEPFNPGDAYPFWDNFTLVDESGMQKVKWSTASVASTRIPAREREHFQRVRDQDLWRLRRGGQEIELYVQSIVTSTRGTKEVVLAKPSSLEGFAASVLLIPMPSMIDPVLPPGFHFAVIDGEGKVLFHSDSERNLSEDFFAETDQDPNLRSAVFAKRSETMDLRYWGDDYIARVEPVEGLPWTIVALREKGLLRDVNLGWIVTTISSILVYLGLLGVTVIAVLVVRPSYRASWLWPDRSRDYVVLSNVLLILVFAFGLAIYLLPGGGDLFVLSILFPLLALVTAYLRLGRPEHKKARYAALLLGGGAILTLITSVLDILLGLHALVAGLACLALVLAAKPRKDQKGSGRFVSPAQSRYAWAGILLLLLTSVLPTLGFFESARRIQFASFVKHGQLRLALSLQERARRVRQEARRERYKESDGKKGEEAWKNFVDYRLAFLDPPEAGPKGVEKLPKRLDVYTTPFFGTRVALLKEEPAGAEAACVPDPGPGRLAKMFGERLPRASESSVQMRDLRYGSSSDCAWQWLRGGANRWFGFYFAAYPEGGGLALASDPGTRQAAAEDFVELLAWLLVITVLAWLVEFVSRNVFLLDPTDPAWPAGARVPARPGLRQFIVSRRGEWPLSEGSFEIDLCALRDGPPESGDRWRRLLRSARGHDVLIRGLEDILEDESFQGEVLELLEKLVEKHQNRIAILSKTSPARLFPFLGRNGKGAPSETEERWRALIPVFEVEDADLRAAQESQIKDLHDVLKEECGPDRDLLEIAGGLKLDASSSITPAQVLEELGDAAEGYYRSLWASCSPQEEVVLEHLAEDGFVSERNRRTVRRLIARGLVKRDPHLRLMNETFRRFVVSATCKSQVRAVEQETEPSAWDRLRVPFFVGLATSLFFLFTTQQALLDGAAGTVAGFAAGIPALMQMMELFGGRFPGMR